MNEAEPNFQVHFEQTASIPQIELFTVPPENGGKRLPSAWPIATMEQELVEVEAEMAALLEERDATKKELPTFNEEIRGANEVVQRLDEKQKTSVEELQAINEKLTTANRELQTRNQQLKASLAHKDHQLLLAIEEIAGRRQVELQQALLLGMVSHELKNPLTSASLATQLLRRILVQGSVVQALPYVQKLSEHHLRLEHLIDDLLDATAIEGGSLRLSLAPFAIDHLLQEVVEQLRQMYPVHRLLIEETAAILVFADRERTRQILTNLLTNALKYSAVSEPILVRIKVAETKVSVQVQDKGKGIPVEQQARIFERFYRVIGPSQTVAEGLGLGLYLTAHLVKQQGGQIWVESTGGQGSIFSFTLPRKSAT